MIGSNQKLLMARAGKPAVVYPPPFIASARVYVGGSTEYFQIAGLLTLIHENNRSTTAPPEPSGFTTIHAVDDTVNSRSWRTSYRIPNSTGIVSGPTVATNSWAAILVIANTNKIGADATKVVSGVSNSQVLPALTGLQSSSLIVGSNYYLSSTANLTTYNTKWEKISSSDIGTNVFQYENASVSSLPEEPFMYPNLAPFQNTWAVELLPL